MKDYNQHQKSDMQGRDGLVGQRPAAETTVPQVRTPRPLRLEETQPLTTVF